MLYFRQDEENRIIFANDNGTALGDMFEVVFMNTQFGEKILELVAVTANGRYVELNFKLVREHGDEDLSAGTIWLPHGFGFVSVKGLFFDKSFVEFDEPDDYKLETRDKDFVLQ